MTALKTGSHAIIPMPRHHIFEGHSLRAKLVETTKFLGPYWRHVHVFRRPHLYRLNHREYIAVQPSTRPMIGAQRCRLQGRRQIYQYDANSRLIQITRIQSVSLTYDPVGRRVSLTLPNSIATTYNYDNSSRLNNITHAYNSQILKSLNYAYDKTATELL